MVTEEKDADTVSKQDEATKQATNESVKILDPKDKTEGIAVSKTSKKGTTLHAPSLKLMTDWDLEDKIEFQKRVADNVREDGDTKKTGADNIQVSSVVSANSDKVTDSDVAKA